MMDEVRRRGLVGVLSASLAVSAAGRDQSPQTPIFRSGVDLVTVDASVVDGNGEPIENLGPNDFVLRVDGQVRRIVSAQYVSVPATRREAARAAAHYTSNQEVDIGRVILLAVDQGNIRRSEGRAALAAAGHFIDRLNPADRVAAVGIPRSGPYIDFTTDHGAVRGQLPRLVGEADEVVLEHNIGLTEALGISSGDSGRLRDVQLRECGSVPRMGVDPDRLAPLPRVVEPCHRQVEQEARAIAQHARIQSRTSTAALRSLIERMRQIEGPKALVLISEGLISEPTLFDTSDLGSVAQAARVTLYALHIQVPLFEASETRTSPTALLDLELRGDGLSNLAGAARGASFRLVGLDPNPFDRIARELSGYYLLAFESRDAERDGRTHRIELGSRARGATVRARQVFKIEGLPGRRAAEAQLEELLRSPRLATELPLRATTYSYQESNSPRLRVIVSAETDPSADVGLGLVLVDEKGIVAASATHRTTTGHLAFVSVVDPGRYLLRLAGVDLAGRRGSLERSVQATLAQAGALRVSDLMLADVGSEPGGALRPSVDRPASQRVIAYLELYANEVGSLREAGVRLELVPAETAAPLLSMPAVLHRPDSRSCIARAELPVQELPPGRYLARAIVSVAGQSVGSVSRPFQIER